MRRHLSGALCLTALSCAHSHPEHEAALADASAKLDKAEERLAKSEAALKESREELADAREELAKARRELDQPQHPPTPIARDGDDLDGVVRCERERQCIIDQGWLQQKGKWVLTQARLVPEERNGRTLSIRVFAIHPGSLFDRLGFRNGDRVVNINGQPIEDSPNAPTLLAGLARDGGGLLLQLDRNGQMIRLSLKVR